MDYFLPLALVGFNGKVKPVWLSFEDALFSFRSASSSFSTQKSPTFCGHFFRFWSTSLFSRAQVKLRSKNWDSILCEAFLAIHATFWRNQGPSCWCNLLIPSPMVWFECLPALGLLSALRFSYEVKMPFVSRVIDRVWLLVPSSKLLFTNIIQPR